jgi:hypothetical protein
MKSNITKGELLNYWNEINMWSGGQRKSILHIFLASKVKEFERLNAIRINTAIKEANHLDSLFYQHEPLPDGNIKWITDEKTGQRILLEGADKAERDKQYTLLMLEEVTVDI